MMSTARVPEKLRIERGRRSGQTIIVSVDSTRLGPALGGCRIKGYPSWGDGVADALRLSAAMTEKAALAGLPHGGGKTVVALTGSSSAVAGEGRSKLLADLGELVESFDGSYIIGPDVGSGPDDMTEIGRRTRHVLCRPESTGGSGDSSRPTSMGVIASIDAVREHLWPDRDPAALSFAVLGLGHVGTLVGAQLASTGARLIVTDVDPSRQALARAWGATWAEPDEAMFAEVDVVVPCAIGGILTPSSVSRLRCRAVVGAANNQLDTDGTADLLHARGICWAPDTVVSAGGIVAAVARELQQASTDAADDQVRDIGRRLAAVLSAASSSGISPLHEARRRAQQLLAIPA
jgi:leucine dehydrogenase